MYQTVFTWTALDCSDYDTVPTSCTSDQCCSSDLVDSSAYTGIKMLQKRKSVSSGHFKRMGGFRSLLKLGNRNVIHDIDNYDHVARPRVLLGPTEHQKPLLGMPFSNNLFIL